MHLPTHHADSASAYADHTAGVQVSQLTKPIHMRVPVLHTVLYDWLAPIMPPATVPPPHPSC
jgi:hypothetical protein